MTNVVLVGADPELFVMDKSSRKIVSAIPFFPEYKGGGEALPCGGSVIHDNVAVEFSMPPAKSNAEFVASIENIKKEILARLRKRGGNDLALLSECASYIVDAEQLNHEHAMTFGCDPDFDAWNNGAANEPPDLGKIGNLRAIGGHVHVGMRDDKKLNAILSTPEGKMEAVKLLDATLGQFIVKLESESSDEQSFTRRRQMYGKAGAYRPKDYGFEYRTPSAIWLRDDKTESTVFHIVNAAMKLLSEQGTKALPNLLKQTNVAAATVRAAINKGRVIPRLYERAMNMG